MIRFLLKMAWRETRASWRHFLYFLVCIAVGVGALVGVSLFAANVERAVTREARSLLGGDLEIRLSRPLSLPGSDYLASLASRDIALTHVSELVAMAVRPAAGQTGGQSTQIVELKAVEPLYPFYGAVRVEPSRPLSELLDPQTRSCPALTCRGAVVQEALLIRMGLTVGDRVTIGQATFLITGVIRAEPDRMANAFSLGPRVFISQEGLKATDLIKVGSRIRERYLLKIPSTTVVEPLLYELRSHLASESPRVSTYRDAQPQLKQFLDQLTRYLGLIGLTALFIGGLGVATSVQAFLREKLTTIAILKTIGADSQTVITAYTLQALMLGLAGSMAGLAMGIGLDRGVPWVVSTWFDSDLIDQLGFVPGLTWHSLIPLGKGLALGLLTTLLFSLWPLLTIREIKPVAIFRRDVMSDQRTAALATPARRLRLAHLDYTRISASAGIGLGLAGLSIWQATSWTVGLLFLVAFTLAVLLLGGASWLAIQGLSRLPRIHRLAFRHAVGNVIRPGSQATSMTIAIGIGVMVIVTVALVERALLRQVVESRPDDSPTFFFIDIQPDQAEGMASLLRNRRDATPPTLTPLVRSRLAALNGQPVKTEALSEEDERQRRSGDKDERRKGWYLTREYVLTFLDELPKDNQIVKGAWWSPGQAFATPLVSLEEEAAHTLGLDIGQTVTLDIQGTPLVATVSSIRKVEWGNFSTNFYMILSPGSLDGAPLTYVATVRVPPQDEASLQQAVAAGFPNVTAINIGDVLESFARMLDRLSLAIRTVALFCVVSGGLVMAAALAATRYRRLYESVILKALGATRGLIILSFAIEYALLGLVGGSVGIGLASALSWGILKILFELPWGLHPAILLLGMSLTVLVTLVVGFLSTYRLLGQRPLAVLRHE